MKKTSLGTLQKYLFFILCSTLLLSCSNHPIDQYTNKKPALIPERFFSGHLTAHGILKNRSGEVIRTFNATIDASWSGNTGTLAERFVFDDGEIQYRTWILSDSGDGTFTATAGDVIGTGLGRISGNALNLNYVLRVPYGDSTIDLSVDDWMYLVDDNTVINESTLSKWGFRVGTIQLAIIRHEKPDPSPIRHPLPDKES